VQVLSIISKRSRQWAGQRKNVLRTIRIRVIIGPNSETKQALNQARFLSKSGSIIKGARPKPIQTEGSGSKRHAREQ
jgi:hypothetical protein